MTAAIPSRLWNLTNSTRLRGQKDESISWPRSSGRRAASPRMRSPTTTSRAVASPAGCRAPSHTILLRPTRRLHQLGLLAGASRGAPQQVSDVLRRRRQRRTAPLFGAVRTPFPLLHPLARGAQRRPQALYLRLEPPPTLPPCASQVLHPHVSIHLPTPLATPPISHTSVDTIQKLQVFDSLMPCALERRAK